MSTFRPLLIICLCGGLAACSSMAPRTAQNVEPPMRGGGYYKDDGPGAHPPADLAAIPDAEPRAEPLNRRANDAYQAFGKTYTPLKTADGYRERGLASWYGRRYHGKPTSIGESYDMYAMTAAHATLPIPSYARVTNLENGKVVVVRINDRGPFHGGRLIDLSYTAAWKLGILKGVTPVEVEAVMPGEVANTHTAEHESKPSVPAVKQAPRMVEDEVKPKATAEKTDPPKSDGEAQPIVQAEKTVQRKAEAGPEASVKVAKAGASDEPAKKAMFLQFAAVSSPTAAEALIRLMRTRFGDQLPTIESINEGPLFKVQAGPFASADVADQLAAAWLKDSGVKPFRVVRAP